MKWRTVGALSFAWASWPGLASAQNERPMALGFNVDLFPARLPKRYPS
jgi:hypothetical protein